MIYLTSLTIGGVEWISKLLYEGTEYSAEVGGNIPTATFTLEDSPETINYLRYSEEFNQAAWTKTASTISANATTDPLGGSTADKLVDTVATDYHRISTEEVSNTVLVGPVTFSVYAKAAEHTRIMLNIYDYQAVSHDTLFDLSAGAVRYDPGGTGKIEDVGSGWYRCSQSVNVTKGDGDAKIYAQVILDQGSGTDAADHYFAGNGSDGAYIWGAMLNGGPNLGEYIKTEALGFYTAAIVGRPEVIAYVGSEKVWGGYAAFYSKRLISPSSGIVRLEMRCQGYAVLMDRAVTTAEHTFSGTDEAALDTLFSTYCSAISTTPVNQVAADLQDMVVPVGTSIRKAVEGIADRSGASWYVTPTKTLEYFDPTTDSPSSPFWLRDISESIYDADLSTGWVDADATYTPATDALIENSATAAHYIYHTHTAQTVDRRYVFTADCKAGTRSWMFLQAEATGWLSTFFNLSTGVVGTNNNNVARIIPLGGGWYRCMIGYTATAAGTTQIIGLASSDGTNNYAGDGSSGAFTKAAYLTSGQHILEDSLSYSIDAATLANNITVRSGADGTETVDIAANGTASDGHVYLEDAFNWPPTGTATPDASSSSMYLKVGHSGSSYFIQLPLVKFDTSVIPDDATIVSASLILRLLGTAQTATGNGIGVEYYSAANWPISVGDYTATPSNSAYGYTNPSSMPAYSSLELALNSPDSNISKTGETGFRIHYSFTGTPASNIIVAQFGTVESGGNAPVLRVTYTSPAAQSNVTDATSISTYGTQKAVIIDSSVASDAEAALIAAVELARRKDPLEYGALETRADGLQIADLVHIESSSYDIDADYLIRSIRVAWPDGILTYSIEYGDWRPDALRLMRQLAALKGVEG